jgi:hypothetical protein
MDQLPDDMILEIAKHLGLKDVHNFKLTNQLNNFLINLSDYLPQTIELPDKYIEYNFDKNKKTKETISIEYQDEQMRCKKVFNIYPNKTVIKCHNLLNSTLIYKATITDINNNFRIFGDKYNKDITYIIYQENTFIITEYRGVFFNHCDMYKFDEKIEIIADFISESRMFYIFTKNTLKRINYYTNDAPPAIDDFTLIRRINPNLYIYLEDSIKNYSVISRYKNRYNILIYLNDIYVIGSYYLPLHCDEDNIQKFDNYVKENKDLIVSIIHDGIDNDQFVSKCREVSKFIVEKLETINQENK